MNIKTSLRDSAVARWSALFLVSLTMFFGYFFVDVAAPLKSLLESSPYNWSNETFGALGGSEFFLNVFAGMLIFSGIILDKMGIRFTIMLAASLMLGGGAIKYIALTEAFQGSNLDMWLNSWVPSIQGSAKLAFFGFAIFGVGVEMAGITVSKTIVRWFKGKELALAMGLEMAFARLGVFAVFQLSPMFAKSAGVEASVFFGVLFLLVGFLSFLLYTFMDTKLDKSENSTSEGSSAEDEFKFSDLGKIITNPGFLAIAGLCVLFYSAIFPFQKFATDMLANKLSVDAAVAAKYVSLFPIGAMILTPFIGAFLDKFGKGATMMIYGAILLTVSHLIFALVPADIFNETIAIVTIIILGTAFSLVPASMWPSIPKIIEEKLLGSAYGLIFFIQNIGLMLVPMFIGYALSTTNPGIAEQRQIASEELGQAMIQLENVANDDIQNTFNEGKETAWYMNIYLSTRSVYDKNSEIKTIAYTEDEFVKACSNSEVYTKDNETIAKLSNILSKYPESNVVIEKQAKLNAIKYNYTVPELIFAGFGIAAFVLGFILKMIDTKKGYGLDKKNIE